MTKSEFLEQATREKWNKKYVERIVFSIEKRRASGLPILPYEYILPPPIILSN